VNIKSLRLITSVLILSFEIFILNECLIRCKLLSTLEGVRLVITRDLPLLERLQLRL
jgi:hypothetical protein